MTICNSNARQRRVRISVAVCVSVNQSRVSWFIGAIKTIWPGSSKAASGSLSSPRIGLIFSNLSLIIFASLTPIYEGLLVYLNEIRMAGLNKIFAFNISWTSTLQRNMRHFIMPRDLLHKMVISFDLIFRLPEICAYLRQRNNSSP